VQDAAIEHRHDRGFVVRLDVGPWAVSGRVNDRCGSGDGELAGHSRSFPAAPLAPRGTWDGDTWDLQASQM
jgi:hypothetical protein